MRAVVTSTILDLSDCFILATTRRVPPYSRALARNQSQLERPYRRVLNTYRKLFRPKCDT